MCYFHVLITPSSTFSPNFQNKITPLSFSHSKLHQLNIHRILSGIRSIARHPYLDRNYPLPSKTTYHQRLLRLLLPLICRCQRKQCHHLIHQKICFSIASLRKSNFPNNIFFFGSFDMLFFENDHCKFDYTIYFDIRSLNFYYFSFY